MSLRKRDRIVLAIVAAVALVGAFYMVALKPERQKASALQTQIATQQQALASAQQSYHVGRAAQAALKTDGAEWAALSSPCLRSPTSPRCCGCWRRAPMRTTSR